MRLMGKKVPDKNIIGNVIMLPTTLAVSVLFVTVPTSIPSEQNIIGPRIKNGMSQTIRVMSVRMMCASNTKIPTAAMSKKEITDKKMYHNTFDANHSSLVSGVKDNCLNSLFFLYSEEMFTIENIGITCYQGISSYALLAMPLFILTGDHGEAFGEHGFKGHGSPPYEEQIRVPLIMKFPHSEFRGRTDAIAQHIDIIPKEILKK